MTVYVAEIAGRSVAAFHAENGTAADALVRDRMFRDDLMTLATNGLPLWDGVTAIHAREARGDEAAIWRASRAKAILQGDIEDDEDAWIAFLVAISDPSRRPMRLAKSKRSRPLA
jgi:hypothetical protein